MKNKKLRIIDIARMAKVSAGTVDRVIHNRGLVAEDKRKRIEKILKDTDYKPNMAARFLASKRDFKFAMVIPAFQKGDYWELVENGAEKAAAELSDFNVNVEYLHFDQFDDKSFEELIPQIEDGDYDGVVIATLHKGKVISLSKILDEKNLPYVFIDSNIPRCNNLSYYGTDSYASGSIAAKLMLTFIDKKDPVIIVHPIYRDNVISTQIENRESGFIKYMEQNNFEGSIRRIIINPGQADLDQLNSVISTDRNIGMVIFNSRIYEIVDVVKKSRLDFSKIHLIGYDSIERNLDSLKNDNLRYLISQRSVQQGYESIKALSNYIIFGQKPKKDNFMPIDILIKENLPFYKN